MSGSTAVTLPGSVSADQTASYQTTYDRAGELTATFETRVGNTVLPSSADSITAAHPNIPGNGSRVFPGSNPPAASINATDLFPFTSPYGLFTGSCESNVLPASLVSALPANVYAHDLRVAPGQAYTVKLFQPAIDVVTQYKGNPVQADVHLTATGPGCGGTLTRTTSPSTGRLADPGFPYGEWTVCAQAVMPNSTLRTSAQVTGVLNDRVDGVGVNLDLPDVTVDTPCV
jgi:hypothetical protein